MIEKMTNEKFILFGLKAGISIAVITVVIWLSVINFGEFLLNILPIILLAVTIIFMVIRFIIYLFLIAAGIERPRIFFWKGDN
jgi:hypothetical protein